MCKFDCSKFIKSCKASCCGMVPFEIKFYQNNLSKIITSPEKTIKYHNVDPFDYKTKHFIVAMTPNLKCCFLQTDYKCAVYEDRPHICKIYGDESGNSLSCHWQDKNGKQRSEKNRTLLDIKAKNNLNNFLKRG